MTTHIKSLADIFEFNSTMMRIGLSDLSNEDARHQVRGGTGSSISYLAGHLLSSRIGILRLLGETDDNPYKELFGGNIGATDGTDYPDVGQIAADWDDVSTRLLATLDEADEAALLAPKDGFPASDKTVRGFIMFLTWHETYHLGQVGMIRTELGQMSLQHRLYEEIRASDA